MAMNQPMPQPSEPLMKQDAVLEESRLRDVLRSLLRHRSAVIGGAIVLFFLLVALLADFIAPYDYAERSEDLLQPPSAEHWFGTDETGRDIFSRVLYGLPDLPPGRLFRHRRVDRHRLLPRSDRRVLRGVEGCAHLPPLRHPAGLSQHSLGHRHRRHARVRGSTTPCSPSPLSTFPPSGG